MHLRADMNKFFLHLQAHFLFVFPLFKLQPASRCSNSFNDLRSYFPYFSFLVHFDVLYSLAFFFGLLFFTDGGADVEVASADRTSGSFDSMATFWTVFRFMNFDGSSARM